MEVSNKKDNLKIPLDFFGSNNAKKNHVIPTTMIDILKDITSYEIEYDKIIKDLELLYYCAKEANERTKENNNDRFTNTIKQLDDVYRTHGIPEQKPFLNQKRINAIKAILNNFAAEPTSHTIIRLYGAASISFPHISFQFQIGNNIQTPNIGTYKYLENPAQDIEFLSAILNQLEKSECDKMTQPQIKKYLAPKEIYKDELSQIIEDLEKFCKSFKEARPNNLRDSLDAKLDTWKKYRDEFEYILNNHAPKFHNIIKNISTLLQEQYKIISPYTRKDICEYSQFIIKRYSFIDNKKVMKHNNSKENLKTDELLNDINEVEEELLNDINEAEEEITLTPDTLSKQFDALYKLFNKDEVLIYMAIIYAFNKKTSFILWI